MTIKPDVVLILLYLLVCGNESVFITSACIYILSVCNLSLGGDWPSAGEYGGCTTYVFSEYSCYSIHLGPPAPVSYIINKLELVYGAIASFDVLI